MKSPSMSVTSPLLNRVSEAEAYWNTQPTALPNPEEHFRDVPTRLDPTVFQDISPLNPHALDDLPSSFPFPLELVRIVNGNKVTVSHPRAEAAMGKYLSRHRH